MFINFMHVFICGFLFYFQDSSMLLYVTVIIHLLILFQCIITVQFSNSFSYWWIFKLPPFVCYYKLCHSEHFYTYFLNPGLRASLNESMCLRVDTKPQCVASLILLDNTKQWWMGITNADCSWQLLSNLHFFFPVKKLWMFFHCGLSLFLNYWWVNSGR